MPDFYDRKSTLNIDGQEFSYPEFDILHEVNFDDDKDPNSSEISIYNLSKKTRGAFKRGQPVTFSAGYGDDVSTILTGVIYEVYSVDEGTDTKTIIKAYDIDDQYFNQQVSKSYAAGTTNQFIINDLLSSFGISIFRIDLNEVVTYQNGFTAYGPLKEVLEQLAVRDGKSRIVIKNSVFNILKTDESVTSAIVVNGDTGLLHVEPINKKNSSATHKITTLFNNQIHARTILQVTSPELNSTCLVVQGKHTSKWETVSEVIIVE